MSKEQSIRIPYNFQPRSYQLDVMKALDNGVKNACWVVHRRGGKDTTMWNYMIKRAFAEPGVYYYFLPTYAQAKRVIWDGMTNDGRKMLDYIPKQIIEGNLNNTEMKVWINGLHGQSLIQLVGADSHESIMGTNPRGVVFSEWSLMDPIAYDYIKPILTANGGWSAFIYCVKKGTLVLTDKGLRRIESVVKNSAEGFTDVSRQIYGLGGFHEATSFYNGGMRRLKRIVTRNGYEISCTPNHPLWNGNHWVRAQAWKVGDRVPIQCGQRVFGDGPNIETWKRTRKYRSKNSLPDKVEVDGKLGYILGVIAVKGWLSGNATDEVYGNALNVMTRDKGLQDSLLEHGFTLVGDRKLVCNSRDMCSFVLWMGVKRQKEKQRLPRRLLECKEEAVRAFVKGCIAFTLVRETPTHWHCALPNIRFAKQFQVLLLNLGHISIRFDETLVVDKSLCEKEFFMDNVMSIEEDKGCVYDFVIPDTHSFFSNGFVSHNTPRGKNHGWDLARIAEKNPDEWFYKVQTVRDTGVLSEAQIESERKKGMPEDLIQQEYYCNFNRGQEGSYYGSQIEELRKKGQICSVPFDPSVPVRTYWDLGVGDSTAIWFAQYVGKEIHLINYYENSGEGLQHYVNVLARYKEETSCVYDLHVAPHDIQARELSTGLTRLQAARKLGLSFRVAPRLSLESGIEAVRMLLCRCWFDERRCEHGIKCLENYRKSYNEKFQVYSDRPFHDYTSHGADAFRYLAVSESSFRAESGVSDNEYEFYRKNWGWRL